MNAASPTRSLPPPAARRMRSATLAQQRQDYAAAEALYRDLTREYPGFADAWHYYGLLLHQRGESNQALDLIARAEALDPDNLGFLINHGRVLLETGEYERAFGYLERVRRHTPTDSSALKLLVHAALGLSREAEMIPLLEAQLARRGDDWQLWMLLGECRERHGDRPGALAAFAEAGLFAPPGEVTPQVRQGGAALSAGQIEPARAAFESALRRVPDAPAAVLGLANVAARKGDFKTCEALARQALARNPRLYLGWLLLASTRGIAITSDLAEDLESAAKRAGDDPNAFPLHFARGQVWEKLGKYERAFAAYELGNRQRAKTVPYGAEANMDFTRDLLATLDEGFTGRAAAVGVRGPGPIFVCGMPRSGTTLVESILASHPEVTPGGEMRYIHDRMMRTIGPVRIRHSGSWLRDLSDAELRTIASDWHASLTKAAAGRARITDKMPGNYALLGFIHVCFPDGHIVHVRRDSRDTCFSCYANVFEDGYSFSYALDTAGHYYRLYEAMVEHWRRVLPPGRVIDVEYEALVADPEGETRRLLAALDLPWEPRCLDFYKTERVVMTASLHQVRQPLYTSSIGRWRHFERHLGPLFAALEAPPPLG